jgi:acetyl-CoA carboxylase biotin carboxylase subunit
MEMNTRIQVEHPITEQVIDYDLIREQILVAAGVPISGKNYFHNYTLLNVESMPKIHIMISDLHQEKSQRLHAPGGHGVRLDTHVYAGYTIPPNYDSMIAKLITTAQTREEAISKMKRALDEFVIEGIKTRINSVSQTIDG